MTIQTIILIAAFCSGYVLVDHLVRKRGGDRFHTGWMLGMGLFWGGKIVWGADWYLPWIVGMLVIVTHVLLLLVSTGFFFGSKIALLRGNIFRIDDMIVELLKLRGLGGNMRVYSTKLNGSAISDVVEMAIAKCPVDDDGNRINDGEDVLLIDL